LAQILRRVEKGRSFPLCQSGLQIWVPVCVGKNDGKEEEAKLGLAPYWKGPSFVEVLRSVTVPIAGGSRSRLRALSTETCVLDLLLLVRHAEEDLRKAVDYFSLESPLLELLDKNRLIRPLGKKLLSHSNFQNVACGVSWATGPTWLWAEL
jgi:hypothetical protein